MTDLPYVLHHELPHTDGGVLVVMLSGWIDASGAAAAAMMSVDDGCNTTPLLTFDSDTFIDYRARRPVMELREGLNTRLVWDEIVIRHGHDVTGQQVITLRGPEPDSRWQHFCREVTDLATAMGIRLMVGLGAYPFGSPHTRPARLSVSTPHAGLLADLPYLKNSVDVPAGMGAALEHALHDAGIPSIGLWVQVPHYVSALGYPAATLSLLRGLRDVAGINVDLADVEADTAAQRDRLDRLVEGNDEHQGMVRQLEEAYDQAQHDPRAMGMPHVPSGDELAAEFERFLRDQGD